MYISGDQRISSAGLDNPILSKKLQGRADVHQVFRELRALLNEYESHCMALGERYTYTTGMSWDRTTARSSSANSVDLTRDYWKRGEHPFLGLKSGDAAKEWMGLEPWQYELTPYSVAYIREDETNTVTVSYDFMETFPA